MKTYRIESVGFGIRYPGGIMLQRVGWVERNRLFNLIRRGEALPMGLVLIAMQAGPIREISAVDIAWDRADLPDPSA